MLTDAQRELLEGVELACVLEWVASQIALRHGEVVLEAVFTDGSLRRAYVRSGPFSPEKLEGRRHEIARLAAGDSPVPPVSG
jgi:hypothetical protein